GRELGDAPLPRDREEVAPDRAEVVAVDPHPHLPGAVRELVATEPDRDPLHVPHLALRLEERVELVLPGAAADEAPPVAEVLEVRPPGALPPMALPLVDRDVVLLEDPRVDGAWVLPLPDDPRDVVAVPERQVPQGQHLDEPLDGGRLVVIVRHDCRSG